MLNNTQFELLLAEYLPPLNVPGWNESLSKLFIYQIHSFQKEPNVDFKIGYWNKIGSIGGGGEGRGSTWSYFPKMQTTLIGSQFCLDWAG